MIYEVFRQEREGQPFQHGGSLEAPNREFAEAYARAHANDVQHVGHGH